MNTPDEFQLQPAANDLPQPPVFHVLDENVDGQYAISSRAEPAMLPALMGQRNTAGTFLPLFQGRTETDWGILDFVEMRKAVALHAALRQRFIQLAPLGWSAANNSPYSEVSSRLIDPIYTAPAAFLEEWRGSGVREFLATRHDQIAALRENLRVQYDAIRRLKRSLLAELWDAFRRRTDHYLYAAYEQFRRDQADWLDDHLVYLEIKSHQLQQELGSGVHWTRCRQWDWRLWPAALRDRDPQALAHARERWSAEIDLAAFEQFVAFHQFEQLQQCGVDAGVALMVDIPFARDGADTWMYPAIFGLRPENGYARLTTQGVPPEDAYKGGQYWQFFAYDWSHPDTLPYWLDLFRFVQKRARYIRLDHVLGFYRTYLFTEDVPSRMTLQSLGLYEALRTLQSKAQAAGTDEARREAAHDAWRLIDGRLRTLRTEIADWSDVLPADMIDLTFSEGGLRPNAMVLIAREVPAGVHGDPDPSEGWRCRQMVVEKRVFKDQPKWDFIRLTPDASAGDAGFLMAYLFSPEMGAVRPNDSLRLGAFRLAPGEALLSEFFRLSQEAGSVVVLETLGTVPKEIQTSVERLGGTNYNPAIWGEVPRWDNGDATYHRDNHLPNSFATFNLHDSVTMKQRWEHEAHTDHKRRLLDAWCPGVWNDRDMAELTPLVRRTLLLEQVYASPARIAAVSWTDLLGLGDDFRLNTPGRQEHQWEVRLPRHVTLENLMAAAQGQPLEHIPAAQRQELMDVVALVRDVMERGRRLDAGVAASGGLLAVTPEAGGAVRQLRRVGKAPFLVEAVTTADRVPTLVIEAGERELRLPMSSERPSDASVRHGANPLSVRWRAQWAAPQSGRYAFHIELDDDTVSPPGLLWAVDPHAELNPLSAEYPRD